VKRAFGIRFTNVARSGYTHARRDKPGQGMNSSRRRSQTQADIRPQTCGCDDLIKAVEPGFRWREQIFTGQLLWRYGTARRGQSVSLRNRKNALVHANRRAVEEGLRAVTIHCSHIDFTVLDSWDQRVRHARGSFRPCPYDDGLRFRGGSRATGQRQ